MAPRTMCPDGRQCRHYSRDITATPDMDGCMGPCRRGIPDDYDRTAKAVAAARAEGRAEGAREMREACARWLVETLGATEDGEIIKAIRALPLPGEGGEG